MFLCLLYWQKICFARKFINSHLRKIFRQYVVRRDLFRNIFQISSISTKVYNFWKTRFVVMCFWETGFMRPKIFSRHRTFFPSIHEYSSNQSRLASFCMSLHLGSDLCTHIWIDVLFDCLVFADDFSISATVQSFFFQLDRYLLMIETNILNVLF